MHSRRWLAVALTVAGLAACYAPTLRGMVDQWWNDEDMGHGFVVPFVIAWIIWRERARWSTLPTQPNQWGFVILGVAAVLQLAGAVGAGLFVSSVAFLLSIAGVVVCFCGFARLRAWAFPFLLALFMLPKLAIVYNQGTLPLQLLASKTAAGMLTLSGFGVMREGNILNVGGHRISVAEACNGIRYLLPLGFMGTVFAYLSDSKAWMRVALLMAAIPVAILANAVRVAVAGASPALAEGTLHAVSGWIIFVLCLVALVPLRRLFNAVYEAVHA